jgi:phage terminase large subunit-like protein
LSQNQKADLAEAIKYRWSLQAREKQLLPEGDWQTWLIMAGRGFGKTRTGAETVRIWKDNNPIIMIAGATASDLRDVQIEGPGGILAISPKWDRPVYISSKSQLVWPNGSVTMCRSADEPDRFRGPQFYKLWADELAAWKYPESWDMALMGLRLGPNPQALVTTTPRPTKIIKDILKDPTTIVTRGSSYENQDNLAGTFFSHIISKYEGTRLGRQELNAELLEDVEGALWSMDLIERNRVKTLPNFQRIVVAIDPATTANKNSDETGIMVCGLGRDGIGYILEDQTGIYSPNDWGRCAIGLYHKWRADRIVAEVNQGGDMVKTIIRNIDNTCATKDVHATKGKVTRAEPVVALYEQNRIKHYGSLPKLEDEMTQWDANASMPSPNRIDAMVWGITDLMLQSKVNTNQWA